MITVTEQRAPTAHEIASMFAGERLAIAPEWEERFASGMLPTLFDKRMAQRVARRAARHANDTVAGMFDDDDDDNAPPYQRIGGVGLVEIDGPLMQHGGWCFDGHESIRSRIQSMASDPRVKLAALRIDSPGGVTSGCFDNVRGAIKDLAAAGIDCVAWCGGNGAFSAAYAWACVADEISVTDTSGCGSVGTLCVMTDRTQMNADVGIKRVVVRSGTRKAEGHPDVPVTDDAIAREQAVVNGMADVFAAVVGTSREMDPADVLSLEGECFYGSQSKEKGLADLVESFDAFLARCVTRAEEMQMKSTATRLGLADTASEADIMKAIDGLEAKVASAEGLAKKLEDDARKASEDRDSVSRVMLDMVIDDAVLSGRKTKGQADSDREVFAEMPLHRAALKARDAYAKIERGAALPKETRQPTDAPQVKGPSVVAAEAGADKFNGATMNASQIAVHYGSAHYERLMNEHIAAQRGAIAASMSHVPVPVSPIFRA